ncbi:hypothetical protein Y1Q_0021879 [Alligator mississippiensis]|uniref:Endonuclease/exonuclease/phosphatase domain-containing protein n=1 Tax=Alligator mississippiensis TaxID=8496 RepID=A0A151M602_ALLMI|nr:hypothetical protein Y1Q_0021879 [Alligator mississippiensis]
MPTDHPLMLMGDFNCVISEEDRVSRVSRMGMDRSSRQLKQLVRNHGLVDAAKGIQGPGGHFTRMDPVSRTKSRINFFFLPTGWKKEKARCTPVCFLNTSLLEDDQTRCIYREHYVGWRTLWNLYQNQTKWWASMKERTRGFFQQVGKQQTLFHQKRHECLTHNLQDLHRQAAVGWDVREAMGEVKAQLGTWYWEEARKKIFQARTPWVEEWSDYFSRLKKSKEEVMMYLKDRQGVEHQSKDGMLATVAAFYWELYAEKLVDPEVMQLCL